MLQAEGKVSVPERALYGSLSIEDVSDIDQTEIEDQHANCSVFETTCNLVSVLTGSGMLSLPFAAAAAGWSALILLLVFGAIFMYAFDLLASSIETYYANVNYHRHKTISDYHIDYLSFGKLTFGPYGDKIVLVVFGTEVSLALVSFLMNIGINIHVINSDISVSMGIILSAIITCIMSFTSLKAVSFSSAVGLALTLLTLLAILATGVELEGVGSREYKAFDVKGVPMALGLIAFCFGGHGTL